MKFSLFDSLRKLWKKSDNVENKQVHQKAIRFEDCERINRERFSDNQNVEINATNQVFAALSGIYSISEKNLTVRSYVLFI